MKETEYKILLQKEEFAAAMEKAEALFGTPKQILQLNYYYDTPNLTLNKAGITVRARQTAGDLSVELKRHLGGASPEQVSLEESCPVPHLPAVIQLADLGELSLKGSLMTSRSRFFPHPGISFDFDENAYLGKRDWECELEYGEGHAGAAGELWQNFFHRQTRSLSKSGRFFEEMLAFERWIFRT